MKLLILGGRPCSGKTTYAYHLGQQTDTEVLYLDVFAHDEVQASSPVNTELYKWKTTEMIDILQDAPDKLFKDYLHFYEELFPKLLTMLNSRTEDTLILESALLLPNYVKELEKHFEVKCVYLRTSDNFVDTNYRKRDYALEMVSTDKGQQALENLLKRDSLFSKHLYQEVARTKFTIVDIIEDNYEQTYEKIIKVLEVS